MNSFEHNKKMEIESLRTIVPLLTKSFNGRIVSTASGSMSIELQKEAGDYLAQVANGNDFLSREFRSDVVGIELKVEGKHTGNIFVETFSNKKFWTPGWISNCRADYMLYHFLDASVCYVINMWSLKKFCFTTPGRRGTAGRLFDYQEVKQKKHEQKNDTWGRLVPINDLRDADCLRVFWSQKDGLIFQFNHTKPEVQP